MCDSGWQSGLHQSEVRARKSIANPTPIIAGNRLPLRARKNIGVFYWIDGPFGYALSGDLEKPELLRVAQLVYQQLNP